MSRPRLLSASLATALSVALVAGASPSVAGGTDDTPSATVRGVVTDAAGKPVANITVVARQVPFPAAVAVRTDARGRYAFTLTNQPAGFTDYNICAAGNQARIVSPPVSMTAADLLYNRRCSAPVDIEAAPSYTVNLRLTRRSVVSGVVTDTQGDPVMGALVVGCPWDHSADGSDTPDVGDTTLTDSRGRYRLSMPSGDAAVSATKEGYTRALYKGVRCNAPGATPPLDVKPATPIRDVDLLMQRRPVSG